MPTHSPPLSYLNGVLARIFVGLRVLCKCDVCASKRPIAADRCRLRASTTDLLPCDISHASDSAVPRSLNQPTPLFPYLAPFLGVVIPIQLHPLGVFHGGFFGIFFEYASFVGG